MSAPPLRATSRATLIFSGISTLATVVANGVPWAPAGSFSEKMLSAPSSLSPARTIFGTSALWASR